jgi:hypothetical protein
MGLRRQGTGYRQARQEGVPRWNMNIISPHDDCYRMNKILKEILLHSVFEASSINIRCG